METAPNTQDPLNYNGPGFRVPGLVFRASRLGIGVSGFGRGAPGFGFGFRVFLVWDLGFGVRGSEFGASGTCARAIALHPEPRT